MIGIDFGTTNSCAAFIDARGDVQGVSVATGNPPYDTVLATLALEPQADTNWIGIEAYERYEQSQSGKYMAYFKPYLDQQRLRWTKLEVELRKGEGYDYAAEGDKWIPHKREVSMGGEHSRDEVIAAAARILEHLISRARSEGASPEADLWLGMPVTFSSCARKRLICALAAARDPSGTRLFDGYKEILRRVHFVLEPVAVAAGAAREDMTVEDGEKVLIFDHGGGTLDLSLIEFRHRAGLARPVPARELSAGGSDLVAGRKIDEAFLESLMRDPQAQQALERLPPYARGPIVERCKIGLSTAETAPLPTTGLSVSKALFDGSIQTILGHVDNTVRETVTDGRIEVHDIGWVVMTGGSSLIPAIQERVQAMFPQLEGRGRILRYFPQDTGRGGGVEQAVTDVARGLAAFGQQSWLDEIVLWDVCRSRHGTDEFPGLFKQGERYEQNGDGRPELRRRFPLPPTRRRTSIGVYEEQLERRYLFGIADVPALPPGSQLEVCLRRDALFPALRVLNADADVIRQADLEELRKDELAEFFREDAEYLPVKSYERFKCAPLVRRLRVDDLVEWTLQFDHGTRAWNADGKRRGVISKIRRYGECLNEMDSWELRNFQFRVKSYDDPATEYQLETLNGYIRLAPRPGKDF